MKIYIDINHPAHIHYFKNFIKIMESKGHHFVVSNRDDKMINYLLDYYKIAHYTRNKRRNNKSIWNVILNLLLIAKFCFVKSMAHKPDIYIAIASFPLALVAFVRRKPCVNLDDTEHTKMNHLLYPLFSSAIITPFYFEKHLGRKQIRFQAYFEQFYLHSKYYKQDVISTLKAEDKYVLIRYIAYDAIHDRRTQAVSKKTKKEIVVELSKKFKVLISEESEFIDDFYKPYLIKIPPEKIHDAIANAIFFISEGATMAAEAGILGTSYVYINPLYAGNVNCQIKNYSQIACQTSEKNKIMDIVRNIIDKKLLTDKLSVRNEIENDTINPTDFLVWFVENYPKSKKIVKEDSNYQYNFK